MAQEYFLHRQQTGEYAYPVLSFGYSVVLPDPISDHVTDMPGGVIPYQKQGLLALNIQLVAHPLQESDGHLTDRTTLDEAQHHLIGISTQQPIAGQGHRVRVSLVPAFLHQSHGSFLISPAMEAWLC